MELATAFYRAARDYWYHRFNNRIFESYFYDAFTYYSSHPSLDFVPEIMVHDDGVHFSTSRQTLKRINFRGVFLFNSYDSTPITDVSLEEFILSLFGKQFPPLKFFREFPESENDPIEEFKEVQYRFAYPTDFEEIKQLSCDPIYLRKWLYDDNVDIGKKIVFAFGYNSGVQRTIATIVYDQLSDQLQEFMTLYYEKIKDKLNEKFLAYLRTGIRGFAYNCGNYILFTRKYPFYSSNIRFENPYGRIYPREPIPKIPLPDIIQDDRHLIGKGGFGSVYRTDTDDYVYKVFSNEESFKYELRALIRLNRYVENFSNLSRVICYDSSKQMFKMMKLYPLPRKMNPFHSEDQMPLFLQIVMGLHNLHSAGLAHNDIKLANVMQTSDHLIEIIDYGLMDTNCIHQSEFIHGTYIYCSPELFGSKSILSEPGAAKIMPAHDIWSTVIMCYELLLGHNILYYCSIHPSESYLVGALSLKFGGRNQARLKIDQDTIRSIDAMPDLFTLIGNDPELEQILRRCVDENPFTRATAEDILTSNYAQRYIPNFIVPLVKPCMRQGIIDGMPFAGRRNQEERVNWIVLCNAFKLSGVRFAPTFESSELPDELYYIDYVALIYVFKYINVTEIPFVPLAYPMPVSNGESYTLDDLLHLIEKYRNIEIKSLMVSQDDSLIEQKLTAAYVDGKFATMSDLEILAAN